MTTFQNTLAALGFPSYEHYLCSEHWNEFRSSYLKSGSPTRCKVCGCKRVQLHHKTYIRLGKEQFSDVEPLCREHHSAVHRWLKSSGKIFVEFTHEAIASLRGDANTKSAKIPRNIRVKKKKARQSQQEQFLEKCKQILSAINADHPDRNVLTRAIRGTHTGKKLTIVIRKIFKAYESDSTYSNFKATCKPRVTEVFSSHIRPAMGTNERWKEFLKRKAR